MVQKIQVNYLDKTKPIGVVDGDTTIPIQGKFSFFSADGPMEIQFLNAPHLRLPDKTEYTAVELGEFKFKCFLMLPGKEVTLDPNDSTGGKLIVTLRGT